jgi:hypothetical protein
MESCGSSLLFSWSKDRRAPPFLRRNLQVVLDSLAMGSKVSAEHPRTNEAFPASRIHLTDPAQPYLGGRRSKRRRITKGSSPNPNLELLDYVETSPASDQTQSDVLSQPSDDETPFSVPIPTNRKSFLQYMVLNDPPEFRKVLKFDIGTIIDKRAATDSSLPIHPIQVQTNCTLAIFASMPKGDSYYLSGQPDHKELTRISQLGSIERTINKSGQAVTRVKLPEPFLIPGHVLYINRLVRPGNLAGQEGQSDNLSAEYFKQDLPAYFIAKLWFSSIGTQRSWPPLDIDLGVSPKSQILQVLEGGSLRRQEITLNCRTQLLENTEKNPRALNIELKLGSAHEPTCYALETNISWSVPIRLNLPTREPPPPVDQNNHITVTYGREPPAIESLAEIKVQGFSCAICDRQLNSEESLRLHLKAIHGGLIFHVHQPFSKPPDLSVSFEEDEPMPLERQQNGISETIQLGPALKSFNTESYLEGDQSWVKSRLGPDDTSGLVHHDSASSSSVHESQRSSPVTSPEVMDIEKPQITKAAPVSKSRTIIVPRIRQRLFDTMTKRLLRPGEELSNSDDEVDENWVMSKHSDIINDFTDVTENEKDYIIHWDTFMMAEKITANKHVEDAILRFVRQNRQWLLERPSRSLELAKHTTILVLRDALTVNGFKECSRLLREYNPGVAGVILRPEREYRVKNKNKGKEKEGSQASPVLYRGISDCVCGKAVTPANAIICCGPVSQLYVLLYINVLTIKNRNVTTDTITAPVFP